TSERYAYRCRILTSRKTADLLDPVPALPLKGSLPGLALSRRPCASVPRQNRRHNSRRRSCAQVRGKRRHGSIAFPKTLSVASKVSVRLNLAASLLAHASATRRVPALSSSAGGSVLQRHSSPVTRHTSVWFEADLLRHRPPFPALAVEERREFLDHAPVRNGAEREEALLHIGQLDDAVDLRVELLEHGPRDLRRREDAVPFIGVVARQPGLGEGRRVRQTRRALGRRGGDRL